MMRPAFRVLCACLPLALILFSGVPAIPAAGRPHPLPLAAVEVQDAARPDLLAWTIERPDAPKSFWNMGNRSLALDAAGHPHLAYGGGQLYYAWHDGTAWHSEVADPASGTGQHASLALDSLGRPHIAYYDAANADLKYAYHDGTSWQVQTVDGAGDVGIYASLALDAADRPHVTYADSTQYDIRYAHHDGTAWRIETVGGATNATYGWSSLALDGAGRPHVAYLDGYPAYNLQYASWDGTAWQVLTVQHVNAYELSLALDAVGQPHIAYHDTSTYGVRYAFYDGTAWQVQAVESGFVSCLSMALDGAGRPRIAYGGGDEPGGLAYAAYDGTAWQIETVVSTTGVLDSASLALDAAGRPHLSHWLNGDLRYALKEGETWAFAAVDGGGDAGRYTSLALDSAGRPHIGYYDAARMEVKYAAYDGLAWHLQPVDMGLAYWAGGVSLALDRFDLPHLSFHDWDYYGGQGDTVRYTYSDGTSWHTETITGSGNAIGTISLALDSAGRPYLGYCTVFCYKYYCGCGSLHYARHTGTAWQIETVASAGGEGIGVSLALDTAGQPHMAYGHAATYGLPNTELHYAYRDGAGWHTEVVETAGAEVGYGNSLALDGAGRPHISTLETLDDYSGAALLYAFHDGTAWLTETVDTVGLSSSYSSLALDAAGQPHIAYYDSTTGDLRYAMRGATGWLTETVDGAGVVGPYPSLAMDAGGLPQVSYYDETSRSLAYARGSCIPFAGMWVAGPAVLPMGVSGVYSATFTPPTATAPLMAWDNGTTGPTALYSWGVTGTHTLAVTGTSLCATASAALTISVFCQEVQGVELSGPQALLPGLEGTYLASVAPITASPPFTYTWDNGAAGPTAAYSWSVTGTYTVTMAAANACGQAQGALRVRVLEEWPYRIYLPLVRRADGLP